MWPNITGEETEEMTKTEAVTKKEPEEIIDQELIDKSIKFINEKANETVYKGWKEIGEYILKTFFDGSIDQASSKNPKKSKSYHKLCESPKLAITPGTLSVMVRVAGQENFFKNEKINAEDLSYTHKAELIKLKNDNPVKMELIKACIEKSLSSRELAELIKEERKGLRNEYAPTPKKYFSYVDRVIKNSDLPVAFDDVKKLEKLKPEIRKKLRKKTMTLSEELKKLSSECNSLLKKLDKVDKKGG